MLARYRDVGVHLIVVRGGGARTELYSQGVALDFSLRVQNVNAVDAGCKTQYIMYLTNAGLAPIFSRCRYLSAYFLAAHVFSGVYFRYLLYLESHSRSQSILLKAHTSPISRASTKSSARRLSITPIKPRNHAYLKERPCSFT